MQKFILILSFIFTSPLIASEEKKSDSNAVTVNLSVTEKGFDPSSIDVGTDKNIVLSVTRKTDSTCATEIQIPSKKIKKSLPLNEPVSINLGKLKKGEIRFACGMDMEKGIINVR